MSKRKSGAPLHFRKALVNGVPCLVSTDDEAAAWLRRQKIGAAVAMSADQVRNAERSALFWCLCSLVAENHTELKSREEVKAAICILAGLTDVTAFETSAGRVIMRQPRSIAFANMGEDEFQAFFERALDVIEAELLPGVDIEELRRESYLRSGNQPWEKW